MSDSTILSDEANRLRRASLPDADLDEVARARRLFAKSQASPEEELRELRILQAMGSGRDEGPPAAQEPPPYEPGDPGPGSDGS